MIQKLADMFNGEDRKRVKLPLSILIIGIILVLLPFLSIFLINLKEGITILTIIRQLNWYQLVLIFIPLFVGIGLLRVKKIAWYALILYGTILILWNIYTATYHPSNWNYFALIESILFFVFILYFLRKDISSPYFKLYPRGWRGEKRYPTRIKIQVNGNEFETRDFSFAGFYFDSDLKEQYELGEEVKVRLPEMKEELNAGIVRIDTNGVGVAFRNLTVKTREEIEQLFKNIVVGEKI
jgi:hypothetical protein